VTDPAGSDQSSWRDHLDRGMEAGFGSADAEGRSAKTLLAALMQRAGVRARVLLREVAEPGAAPPTAPVQDRSDSTACAGRYRFQGDIAQGGMGVIRKGHDQDLGRDVAVKVVHDRYRDDPAVLRRFVEEAQIGGQLQHPGIVPVYELGLDDQGRVCFAMQLVRGRSTEEIFDLCRAGREGWSITRGLEVVLKVCDTLAFAHEKGVLHRDLKPGNVMVGRHGEVYVVDWGLAKVLGQGDSHDLRLRPQDPAGQAPGAGRERQEADLGSPVLTMDGAVVGTPSYMPPEQAMGQVDRLDQRADVYAVGALLYRLLTGCHPYVAPGARVSAHEIVRRVVAGPPTPVHELDHSIPAELTAICERAMAREIGQRFRDLRELAEELRAYLDHRVVKSYRTGAMVEMRLWIRRNRGMAAGIAAAFLVLVLGLVSVQYARNEAETSLERFQQLSALVTVQELSREADELWPEVPTMIPPMTDWLARAERLYRMLPEQRAALDAVRGRGRTPGVDEARRQDQRHPRWRELLDLQARAESARTGLLALAAKGAPLVGDEPRGAALQSCLADAERGLGPLRAEIGSARVPEMADDGDRFLFQQLSKLVTELDALGNGALPDVRRRIAWAQRIGRVSLEDHRAAWADAIDRARQRYGGLVLTPQTGLVPIGPDPQTRLEEFWHVRSGDRPERGADGRLVPTETMGIVLVLLPGGRFTMGAERDPARPHYDPQAYPNESPPHEVPLVPFFLSKYEMTQGQWLRATGENPSFHHPGSKFMHGNGPDKAIDLRHPVELVSLETCTRVLGRFGLRLPTEAQWEYGARAGSDTPYWFGTDPALLATLANVADRSARTRFTMQDSAAWDDGHVVHGPVGHWPANGFALHEVCGNVWEWCRDNFGEYLLPARPGDGERLAGGATSRVARGGAWFESPRAARSSNRIVIAPGDRDHSLGCRPCRDLTREQSQERAR
jgi:formylglycine-generating enzyme required for sulfatase activity/serine/threonine protein kinase